MNTLEFNKRITEGYRPLVVDFWAPWCVPCRMTKPILDKLAREYAASVDFIPINADDSREVLEKYKILGIPAVLAFRKGEEVGRVTGAQTESNYRLMFEALAAGKEVKIAMTSFDRLLRLGAGAIFLMIGISTSSIWLAGIGGILAFMGFYDRCPVWNALKGLLTRN